MPGLGMTMKPDDEVCVCHHVTLHKIDRFLQRERPEVASKVSECLGAGTGCGWCIPFLEKLHKQSQNDEQADLGVDFDRYTDRRASYLQKRREGKSKG